MPVMSPVEGIRPPGLFFSSNLSFLLFPHFGLAPSVVQELSRLALKVELGGLNLILGSAAGIDGVAPSIVL